ncbi:MAG: uroporphyrinogen-III synthase [Pseudomonadota bacterium]
MNNLTHLKILITRPAQQAKNLAAAILAYGGETISFPTLEIIAITKENFLKQTKKIGFYDFVIFLSPNAVLKTANYIYKIYPDWPTQTKIMAIGSGTANALKQEGLPVDYYPKKNFSSEGLLELPSLQNPKQKKILILQGEKGRGYLDKELEKKGAHVTTVNTYKRLCPHITKKCIPNPNTVNIIICTSNTGLKNLITLLQPYWHATLLDKQLLLISPRIADYAKKLGFVKPPLISDNASNAAILQTLSAYAKENFREL